MGKEIRIQRFYPYPIDKVWTAITTSEALTEWLMPNDFKLEINHEFKFRTKPQPGFDGIVKCKVIDFEIPSKLQFTWQGGPLKKPTLVTFELKETNNGTHLHFTHSGFEGFINQYIVRFILGSGWKGLLKTSIKKYLDK